jgi:hypothetical protein
MADLVPELLDRLVHSVDLVLVDQVVPARLVDLDLVVDRADLVVDRAVPLVDRVVLVEALVVLVVDLDPVVADAPREVAVAVDVVVRMISSRG